MKATIVDLRYRMKDVLAALDRNEDVTVYHRGKLRGTLRPIAPTKPGLKVQDHPFFGSSADSEPVAAVMQRLRAPRHRAV